jgi:hypothetical protein
VTSKDSSIVAKTCSWLCRRNTPGHQEGVSFHHAIFAGGLSYAALQSGRHAKCDQGAGRLQSAAALGVFEATGSAGSAGGQFPEGRQGDGDASRNESPAQRVMHRADRIANRLHDMCKSTNRARWEFPPKPSRMRWQTYLRLKQRYDELQGRWMAGVRARFGFCAFGGADRR